MAILVLVSALAGCATETPAPAPAAAPDHPPPAPREFRAAWVASVANIDWPSKRGLPVAEQKAEIVKIAERAKELRLNALIVQVRPAADAIYPSGFEPWTEYLSGETGRAPEPFYDPLKMWIEEAHKRGLELHAWFNPYRARHNSSKSTPSRDHIANTMPSVVKEYGGYLWMDPAEPAAAQRTLDVILDVVKRYDVDGVHIDDYFYPYPVNAPGTTTELDFPDEPSWRAYLATGGTQSRADWRRGHVDRLIERIYKGVHAEKSWVRFGVSPFGIGKPDRRPAGIAGFSQYDKLYADVELWLAKGWMDYFVPQLYWPIDQQAQSFPVLLDYWRQNNPQSRHLWPGYFTSRIDASAKSWMPEEIVKQIHLTRTRGAATPSVRGHVHFSMVALMENRRGINDQLLSAVYGADALVPATPWLDNTPPPAPTLIVRAVRDGAALLRISPGSGEPAWQYALWTRERGSWRFSVVPANDGAAVDVTVAGADVAFVTAVDRLGNESARVSLALPGAAK